MLDLEENDGNWTLFKYGDMVEVVCTEAEAQRQRRQ